MRAAMQTMLHAVFPPQCALCSASVSEPFGICATCLPDIPFIVGSTCSHCGAPVPDVIGDGDNVSCDDCVDIARPWSRARAVLRYEGLGRQLVLQLKHADRVDLAKLAGPWLARAAAPMIERDTVIVPVPLHNRRLFQRRYNQAALLCQAMAQSLGARSRLAPLALVRPQKTPPLEKASLDERFSILKGSMRSTGLQAWKLKDASVLIVDDVMTSGATLAAATEAAMTGGAGKVSVLVLARVLKGDPLYH